MVGICMLLVLLSKQGMLPLENIVMLLLEFCYCFPCCCHNLNRIHVKMLLFHFLYVAISSCLL